jgi:hypothetical protein
MATLAFATFSLDKAMLVGFGAYAAQPIFCKSAKFSPVLLLSFALLSLSVIIQLMFS